MPLQFPVPNILRLCHQIPFAQHGGEPCWAAASPNGVFRDGEVVNDVTNSLLPALNPTVLMLQLAGYEVNRIAFRIKSPPKDTNHFLEISLTGIRFTNYPLDGVAFPRPWSAVTGIQWSGTGLDYGRIPESTSIAVAFQVTPRPAHRDGRETFAIPLNLPLGNVTFGSAADFATTSIEQWLCLAVDDSITSGFNQPPALWSALRQLEPPLADLESALAGLLVSRWRQNDGQPEGLLHIFSPYQYNTRPGEFAMPDNWGWGNPDCWLGGKSWRAFTSLIDQIYEVWQPMESPDRPPAEECGPFLGMFASSFYSAEQAIKTALEMAAVHSQPIFPLVVTPSWTLQDLIEDVKTIIFNAQEIDDQFEYSESDRLIAAIEAGELTYGFAFSAARDRLLNERQAHLKSIQNAVTHRLENLGKLTWAEVLMCLHDMKVIDILGLGGPDFLQLLEQPVDYTGHYDPHDLGGEYTVQLNQAGDYVAGYLQLRIPRSIRDDLNIRFSTGTPPIELYSNARFHEFQLYWITFSFSDPSLCKIAPLYPVASPDSSTPFVPNDNVAVTIESWERVAQQDSSDFVIRLQLSQPLFLASSVPVATPDELVLKRVETRPFFSEDAYLHLPQDIGAGLRSEYRYPMNELEWGAVLDVVSLLSQYLFERNENLELYRTLYPQLCDALSFCVIFDGNGSIFRHGEQWLYVQRAIRTLAQLTPFASFRGFRNIYVAVAEYLATLTAWTYLETLIVTLLGLDDSELVDYSTLVPTTGSYKYEWQMISGGGTAEASVGVGAGIGLVHIRTLGYPERADPDAIFDSWYYVRYAQFVPPFPFGGGGYGAEYGASVSEWSELEANESWSSDDFAGNAVNYTLYAVSGAFIIGYSTDEDVVVFFEPGHKPLVGSTNDAYLVGIALEFETNAFAVMRLSKLIDSPVVDPLMLPWQSSTAFSSQNSSSAINYFSPPGSSTLSTEAKQLLRRMVSEFRSGFESPHSTLMILGYASRTGQPADNQDLSERRARVVYDYIYSLLGKAFQIPTNHIAVRGYGERVAEFAGQEDNIEDPDWRKVEIRLNGVLISRMYGELVE